jgi:hypothetical protein
MFWFFIVVAGEGFGYSWWATKAKRQITAFCDMVIIRTNKTE